MSHEIPGISTWARVGLGTLVAGMADLAFAMGFWWLAHHVRPERILQSIACGWFGDASYEGGMRSALVGAVSHFAIIFAFIAAYRQAARYTPVLRARPLAAGAIYGLGLYALMNFIVLPLSAAGMASFDSAAWVAASIAMHVVIGMLCAWYALSPPRRPGHGPERQPA